MILTSKERNFLRKKAHPLEAVVRIGKEGVTHSVIESIKNAIDKKELIKIKILQNSSEEITEELWRKIEIDTNSTFVYKIGNTMIFFKQQKKDHKLGPITEEFLKFKKKK